MNLTATNEVEKRVLEYVIANASLDLMQRIENEGKTMQGCMKYIYSYAKVKIAMDKRHGEVCVCVPPEEVFGQAIHYFEDESEGATYKSEEEKQREWERQKEATLREEEERKAEEERIAALTPAEREAEEHAKREAETARREAEEQRKKKELERQMREKAKREAEERKRKLAEAQQTFDF